MSNAYYNQLWLVAQKGMEKLLNLDRMVDIAQSPKTNDVTLDTILYLKYRDLVNRLIICYDQTIQPQKRELIKQVLGCSIGRMLEYDRRLVELESNDHRWPDDIMIRMKITPHDMALPVPMSYADDRKIFLRQRRDYIQNTIDGTITAPIVSDVEETVTDVERKDEEALSSSGAIEWIDDRSEIGRRPRTVEAPKIPIRLEASKEKLARETREAYQRALLLIGAHERARSARWIGAQAEREYMHNKRLASGAVQARKIDRKVKNKAATVIQKYWRGYVARERHKKLINRIEESLDMTIPRWTDKSVFRRDKDNYRRRVSLRPAAVTALEETINAERARVFRIKGPGLVEDITDEIREWFVVWYNSLGYFDAYPIAETGGTILVATGQTLTPDEYIADRRDKGDKKSSQSGQSKNGNERPMPDEESKALRGLGLAEDEFIRNWKLRDETDDNREYLDIINEKLCHELQLEMREVADELMRLELAKLNEALRKDHAGDKEKFVPPTMVRDKKTKKKAKRKKGKKDALDGVTTEEMFSELVGANIIHNYPEEHLDDWQGDMSYQNFEARLQSRDYQHRIGEIKDSVMKYCVLPLGSRQIHAMAPLVKSVCICGMPRCGKSFLANAICTEVGALLFDLTPRVLVGQYEGKKNQEKLMKMIGRLAREYAPSVVFIDGGDKPWWKKIPIAERYTQPKRLVKLLPKFVKTIRSGDQVLFLTLATEPYRTRKGFLKIHQKFIIIPIADYNTIYMFYKNLLTKYDGKDGNLDISSLARLSVGYPLELIRQAVEKVTSVKERLRFGPLDPRDILAELLAHDGPASKTSEQFRKFEAQTPLGKIRTKLLQRGASVKNMKIKK